MKILFVLDGLRAGGKERRFVSLAKELVKKTNFNFEIIIFNQDVHYDEIYTLNRKIHFVVRKRRFDILSLLKFYKIAKAYNPDIIHSWDTLSTLFAIPFRVFNNIKLLTSKISDAPLYYRKFSVFGLLSEICFLMADKILANSQAGLDSYGVSSKKSVVIYNGFDFLRIQKLESKSNVLNSLGIKEKKIIGMVASFKENKDWSTFLEMAKEIRNQRSDVAFICIGEGPLLSYFKNKYNLNGIYFAGKKNNVESIINCFDIGVLSTVTEGISNTIMEYMALKKPVVVSGKGGCKEIVIHGYNGFLYEPFDKVNTQKSVLYLLNNRSKSDEFGINGFNLLNTNFSIDKMTTKFITEYKAICENC